MQCFHECNTHEHWTSGDTAARIMRYALKQMQSFDKTLYDYLLKSTDVTPSVLGGLCSAMYVSQADEKLYDFEP